MNTPLDSTVECVYKCAAHLCVSFRPGPRAVSGPAEAAARGGVGGFPGRPGPADRRGTVP